MNTRAMLTDHEGKFRFEQNTDSTVNLLVTKPGFFFTTEYGDPGNVFLLGAQLGTPLELRLYPEALLTGTVLGADGSPLARIPVTALREVFEDAGRRWIGVAQAATDGHGNFRLPVPSGAYRLETHYVARNSATGEAVLPLTVPADSSTNTSQIIRVSSGEEQHFELRPAMGRTHGVTVILRGSSAEPGFARITARSSSGSQLQTNAMRDSESGGMKLELPQGTYALTARTNTGEGSEEAETTVTVPDHDIAGVVLQFSQVPSIPVEMVVDGGVTSGNPPSNLTQFGLTLQSDDAGSERGNATVRLQAADGRYAFTVPAGSYRLQARSIGGWYVKAATYGDSDLLQQELTVAPGASGSPIRVMLSNQTGGLQGVVTLNGEPAACWIYLVPATPGAQSVISTRSSAEGSYSFASLPPGSYRALAFERRHGADYRDSGSLAPFTSHLHAVSVSAGDKATLNLDAVPVSEMAP